ncbi:MAG: hypothetical protein JXP73_05345 [Deltaproteobacteria bacterium]|nr:hypothetical protein [Deltaproteobacteria bacterium]
MKAKRAAKKARARAKVERPRRPRVLAKTVETPVPFLEVVIRERVTEESMVRIFEQARAEVLRHTSRRVFVDLRESSVDLTISDMAGLAKMVAGAFAGAIDRFVLLMRPQDILPEKFFEPSVSSRGVPTRVTSDLGDALHFLTAKMRPTR